MVSRRAEGEKPAQPLEENPQGKKQEELDPGVRAQDQPGKKLPKLLEREQRLLLARSCRGANEGKAGGKKRRSRRTLGAGRTISGEEREREPAYGTQRSTT